MLTDLKGYLAQRRGASLSEIARHFSTAPDAVRPMLDLWIRKGKVRRMAGSGCSGCHSCAAADVEIYEWTDLNPEAKPRLQNPKE